MKDFLKFTLATVTGIILSSIVLFIVSMVTLFGIMSASDTETIVKKNSVMMLDLNGTLVERTQENPLDILSQLFSDDSNIYGLDDILSSIKKAKENENIKGIYLQASSLGTSYASLQEIRNALLDFKESGKFIIAYGDSYTQGLYYLSSVADKVLLNPKGMIEWRGIAAAPVFYKDLLQKIGVEMQIFKVGTYKSAVEPYINTQMSEANREQTMAYMTPIWNHLLEQLSQDRDISVDQLNNLADTLLVTVDAKELIAKGLVDTLMYRPQMNEFLKAKVGIDKDDDLIFASINEVASIKQAPNKAKDEIAIVYAEGGIDMGETNGVNTAKLVEDLTKIQNDKNVKAVVLRVNSPGGSAYGSEQVWAAIEAIKAAGKPVAVSMGDVAASGGYYISCNADRIFANPTTLTGSIGIYGLIPNYKGLLTGKLGLTFDGVQTNKYGNFPSVSRAMTTDEHRQMQQYIERGYELFTTRCAEGRGMSIEAIKKIAEGRVWDGATALEIGLVDELGDLDAAIEWVAQKAKLDKYKTSAYPKQKTAMEQLMDELGMNVRSKIAASYLGENYKYFKALEQCQNIDPVQYRMEDIELY